MNTPVRFELAKLLKEKGYNEEGLVFWWDDILYHYHSLPISKKEGIYTWLKQGILIHAPTIADIVMWLYEKHRIWIEVKSPDYSKELWSFAIHRPYKFGSYGDGTGYKSPTEAYEAAIEYTLNNLI